jgi:hypothetical protein
VELRVVRAIVNLTGRFEADIESSRPEYTPNMNNHGLPLFEFDKTKAELGVIVKGLTDVFDIFELFFVFIVDFHFFF